MQSATTYDIYQSQTEATSRVVPSPRYSQPCQPVVTISWWIIHSLLLLCLPLFSILRKHKILKIFPPLSCLRAPYKATRILVQRKEINISFLQISAMLRFPFFFFLIKIEIYLSLSLRRKRIYQGGWNMQTWHARDNFWATDDPWAFSLNLNRGKLPNLYTPASTATRNGERFTPRCRVKRFHSQLRELLESLECVARVRDTLTRGKLSIDLSLTRPALFLPITYVHRFTLLWSTSIVEQSPRG